MKNEPKISVIIPVYNVEKYLRYSLDSVCRQSYPFLEIICINDGSTDSSGEILKEYSKKDGRIVVYNQENSGASVSRNRGLELSTSDWVSFIDSDDVIRADLFQNFVNALNITNEFDIYMFNGVIVSEHQNPNEKGLKKFFYDSNWVKQENNIYTFKDCRNAYYGNLSVWNKIYSKKLLSDNNIRFKENTIFEDQLFTVDVMIKSGGIYIDNKNMYYYVQHPKSVMNGMGEEVFDIFGIMADIKQVLFENDLYDNQKYLFLQHKFNVYNYLFLKLNGERGERFYEQARQNLRAEITDKHDMDIVKKIERSNLYFDFQSLSAAEYSQKHR